MISYIISIDHKVIIRCIEDTQRVRSHHWVSRVSNQLSERTEDFVVII